MLIKPPNISVKGKVPEVLILGCKGRECLKCLTLSHLTCNILPNGSKAALLRAQEITALSLDSRGLLTTARKPLPLDEEDREAVSHSF